ncbi:elongation factor 1-beta-like [Oscarella lobularis]|uniref:elongation factor 1-beta-like n=1 Tax=Oscarella lobularis TaxID=121494 RepID=UPI0033141130
MNPIELDSAEFVWLQQRQYEQVEAREQERIAQAHKGLVVVGKEIVVGDDSTDAPPALRGDLQAAVDRIAQLEKENRELKQRNSQLEKTVKTLQSQVNSLQKGDAKKDDADDDDDDDDDDVDLFGSDDEEDEEEAEARRAERAKAYQEKKSKKPAIVAKSSVILFVKPWDDETDMKEMERLVRSIEMDGLVWGAAKLVPVGYGINKLQISCVVVDEKVSIEDLSEDITTKFEDHVQSVDVAAFNKL